MDLEAILLDGLLTPRSGMDTPIHPFHDYLRREREALRKGRRDRNSVDAIVRERFSSLYQRRPWVVLARGSYARLDFTSYSDADLLFLDLGLLYIAP